jgi:hypothetical protein
MRAVMDEKKKPGFDQGGGDSTVIAMVDQFKLVHDMKPIPSLNDLKTKSKPQWEADVMNHPPSFKEYSKEQLQQAVAAKMKKAFDQYIGQPIGAVQVEQVQEQIKTMLKDMDQHVHQVTTFKPLYPKSKNFVKEELEKEQEIDKVLEQVMHPGSDYSEFQLHPPDAELSQLKSDALDALQYALKKKLTEPAPQPAWNGVALEEVIIQAAKSIGGLEPKSIRHLVKGFVEMLKDEYDRAREEPLPPGRFVDVED